MSSNPEYDRSSQGANARIRWSRLLAMLLFCMSSMTLGCTTTTYFVDEEPTVTEAVAMRDLGIDYLTSGRTAMAIRELTASIEFDSSDPKTHLWLGEAYRRKGKNEKAQSALKEALELAVDQGESRTEQEARLSLSALLSQLGHYEEALVHCSLLASDPTFSTPWRPLTNCGWALGKLGRLEESRESLVEALDYFPRYGPALLNLGILEAKEGHRLAAIRTFQRALESRIGASAKAEANYRLGELFVALGRRNEAVTHFREAAKAAPNLDWGSQSQAYLDLLR